MFNRDRNPPEKIPTTPAPETIEFDAYETLDKKLEKQLKRRNRMPQKIGAISLIIAAIGTPYWMDIEANRAERAEAKVSINIISELPDETDAIPVNEQTPRTATVWIGGYNMYDGDDLAKKMGKADSGEVWALGNNNAVLNRDIIANIIVEKADERNIGSVSISGYSMGGIMAIEAGSDITVDSTLEVDQFTAIQTPNGTEGLQESTKKELGFFLGFINWFPGAIDSTYVRYLGELISFNNIYTRGEFKDWDIAHNIKVVTDNIGRFFRTANSLWGKVNSPKGTSLQLMLDQERKMDEFDGKKELERMIAVADTKQMPTGLYIGSDTDKVVNSTNSSEDFMEYSRETGIKIHVYEVPNAIHSQYNKTIDEYLQAFDRASDVMARDIQIQKDKHQAYLAQQEEISIEAKG